MATLFDWADKTSPKTKKVVIGLVLFGMFLGLLPDEKNQSRATYVPPTAPVSTPTTSQVSNSVSQSANDKDFNNVLNSVSTTANGLPVVRRSPSIFDTHIEVPTTASQISAVVSKIEPSFECAKAQLGIEKIICSDAELASLDKQVSEKYFATLQGAQNDQKDYIKKDQRDFLKFRISSCDVPIAIPPQPDIPKYVYCLKSVYSQRLSSIQQALSATNLENESVTDSTVSSIPVDNELPWLKEKRLKAEANSNLDSNSSEEAPVTPVFNQNDFNACMDGDKSRCQFEVMTPQQQAIITAADKRNYTACLNGWSYGCNKKLLTVEQQELVQKSDLQRNYTSCVNGWNYACNKSLLTVEQLDAVNASNLERNRTACMNGWNYACNTNFLSSDEREQMNRNTIQRNYTACLNGWAYACNRQLLTPEQLAKMPMR